MIVTTDSGDRDQAARSLWFSLIPASWPPIPVVWPSIPMIVTTPAAAGQIKRVDLNPAV